MTYEERKRLYEALQTIKSVCKKCVSCSDCAMYNGNDNPTESCCQLRNNSPHMWALNNPSDWKAIL